MQLEEPCVGFTLFMEGNVSNQEVQSIREEIEAMLTRNQQACRGEVMNTQVKSEGEHASRWADW